MNKMSFRRRRMAYAWTGVLCVSASAILWPINSKVIGWSIAAAVLISLHACLKQSQADDARGIFFKPKRIDSLLASSNWISQQRAMNALSIAFGFRFGRSTNLFFPKRALRLWRQWWSTCENNVVWDEDLEQWVDRSAIEDPVTTTRQDTHQTR